MRPHSLKTKIFLDSGDPVETEKAIEFLGFLDGQTTNPSLIAKLLEVRKNPMNCYRESVQKISDLILGKSVSIEVNADKFTTSGYMLAQAIGMNAWVPDKNIRHIKFPITTGGIVAAQRALEMGIKVNMTLCFSQEQAAAVYIATLGAKKGSVFISPFVGRLDDIGRYGMDLIENIIKMYRCGDGHVEILTASVRSTDHLKQSIYLGSDIVTCPLKVLEDWKNIGMPLPTEENFYSGYFRSDLAPIPYKEIDLKGDWQTLNITHPLTDAGIEKFSKDWNSLFGK